MCYKYEQRIDPKSTVETNAHESSPMSIECTYKMGFLVLIPLSSCNIYHFAGRNLQSHEPLTGLITTNYSCVIKI